MTKTAKLLMLSALLVFGAATLTQAQVQTKLRKCAPRDAIVDQLAQIRGETRQSIGLDANNAMMELFASRDTGTWTIAVTLSSGVTCIVASGQAFETLAEALPPQGEDA